MTKSLKEELRKEMLNWEVSVKFKDQERQESKKRLKLQEQILKNAKYSWVRQTKNGFDVVNSFAWLLTVTRLLTRVLASRLRRTWGKFCFKWRRLYD